MAPRLPGRHGLPRPCRPPTARQHCPRALRQVVIRGSPRARKDIGLCPGRTDGQVRRDLTHCGSMQGCPSTRQPPASEALWRRVVQADRSLRCPHQVVSNSGTKPRRSRHDRQHRRVATGWRDPCISLQITSTTSRKADIHIAMSALIWLLSIHTKGERRNSFARRQSPETWCSSFCSLSSPGQLLLSQRDPQFIRRLSVFACGPDATANWRAAWLRDRA